MAFGRSSRSKRPSSPEPPPKPPRPQRSHQQTQAAPGASYNQTNVPYIAPVGACSVSTLRASPQVPYQNGPMSMVHLPSTVPSQSPYQYSASAVSTVSAISSPLPKTLQPPQRPSKWKSCTNLNQSMTQLVSHTVEKTNATILELENLVHHSLRGGANVNDATCRLLDQVITSIDLGSFCGRENELSEWCFRTKFQYALISDGHLVAACTVPFQSDAKKDRRAQRQGKKPAGSVDYFSKVYLYANARLPPQLTPLKFYLPTYPLLQLAAKYSRRVYDKPSGHEKHSYVNSDWRQGTKAMVVKSLPVDDLNTIVFAIRGTQSFMDWAVNVHTAPTSPQGFLDDPSNCCHSGFLSVARKMVAPVAARLRNLLEEDPNRMAYSLIFTGHSAGGAVASLLYLHLLSESPAVCSELTHLRGCFKRIHCITFGAPPISIRPFHPFNGVNGSKSMFFAFINEGDPVARADKGYFLSLLDLYVKPAPGSLLTSYDRKNTTAPSYWRIPRSTLSLAGRLVVIRSRDQLNGRPMAISPAGSSNSPGTPPALPPKENVDAFGIVDADLKGVVFGDPVMHFMDLYSRRIDSMARAALSTR
ncbi:unnamed protein product [Penicillium salamii]|uniref:Fungal lipase-type domain-containing protein n=1 Tax=Penicillium salamii TaxID=1612424 RepID=A0A9W4J4Q7_9EURO|nr:unnamed protein product [Penicillium salamii]CAG8032878.1 unnamed protein product [Penicillium salamii]CAG8058638.1 unnamed protein product [Penicillium salamii]CAG8110645.1 unnamed protein product [Penicillium salamii]CAG8179188.1 unnamed protein product [Penicillium salamii]